MTRKHYRAIAHTIKTQIETHVGNYEPHGALAVAELVRKLADDFKRENSTFRYDVFFAACGLDSSGYLMPSDCDTLALVEGHSTVNGR